MSFIFHVFYFKLELKNTIYLDQDSKLNQSSPGRVFVGLGVYFNLASVVFLLTFSGTLESFHD